MKKSSKELVEQMARLARMIRDMAVASFEQGAASDELRGLYQAFKDALIPELSVAGFADMFAQTLTCGLFAARYHRSGAAVFRRQDAARELPSTDPFLRKLFSAISGPDLEGEPFIGVVDELARLMALTDLGAVLANFGRHTRLEDPLTYFYETFLSAYDPKLRELRGVYYTPEPVVAYMVRSVDQLLKAQFDCPDGLADTSTITLTRTDARGQTQIEQLPRVLLLDPACGTGTFSSAVIRHIHAAYQQQGSAEMWADYARQHVLPRLFGFELLMAPYVIAHLRLGMQLAGLDLPEGERGRLAHDFQGNERLGISLTNTLEEAARRLQMLLGNARSDEPNEAAGAKNNNPVMVILGNPPYAGHSANKGEWITNLLRGREMLQGQDGSDAFKPTHSYFEVDGRPLGERNPKWLNDDYVKFIRFAHWCIEQTGSGVLAFITNHGYLDNPTFRGMRQKLMQTFDDIYTLDLHGNSKKQERAADGGKDENVFDIQQGVAICIFVKRPPTPASTEAGATLPTPARPLAAVHHAHLWGERAGKYAWLAGHDITTTEWKAVSPQSPLYLFAPQNGDLRAEYEQGWRVTEALPMHTIGLNSHRDAFAIDFERETLLKRMAEMRDTSITDQALAEQYGLSDNRDWQLAKARQIIRADEQWQARIVPCLYRPFDWRYCYLGEAAMDYPRTELNRHFAGQENVGLVTTRQTREPFAVLVVNRVCGQHKIVAAYDGSSVFPLYLYPDAAHSGLCGAETPGSAPGVRRANLAPAFVEAFAARLGLRRVADGRGGFRSASPPTPAGEPPAVQVAATVGPEDMFAYMYAVLHSPTYRERYAEFLKMDFPRLPLTSNPKLFRALCALGDELVRLHLLEGQIAPGASYPVPGSNVVEYARYTAPGPDLTPGLGGVTPTSPSAGVGGVTPGRVWINGAQYFEGVAPEVWAFLIGGYQVCQKWLKDRKGRALSPADLLHYQRTITALAATSQLMEEIDAAIEAYGGWPLG